jgi:hypothetical protein
VDLLHSLNASRCQQPTIENFRCEELFKGILKFRDFVKYFVVFQVYSFLFLNVLNFLEAHHIVLPKKSFQKIKVGRLEIL